jgi:hypothetical protein
MITYVSIYTTIDFSSIFDTNYFYMFMLNITIIQDLSFLSVIDITKLK